MIESLFHVASFKFNGGLTNHYLESLFSITFLNHFSARGKK